MPGTPMAKSHSLFSVNSFTWRGVMSCSASPFRSSGLSAGRSRGTSSPCRRSVGERPTLRWRSDALRCTSCCSTSLKSNPLPVAEGAAAAPAPGADGAGRLAIRVDAEERLAILHRLRVGGEHLRHHTGDLGLDLVHDLHRLDDAEDLPLRYARAHGDIGLGPRFRRAIEGADHRRLHLDA